MKKCEYKLFIIYKKNNVCMDDEKFLYIEKQKKRGGLYGCVYEFISDHTKDEHIYTNILYSFLFPRDSEKIVF